MNMIFSEIWYMAKKNRIDRINQSNFFFRVKTDCVDLNTRIFSFNFFCNNNTDQIESERWR